MVTKNLSHKNQPAENVDEYIATFPKEGQQQLTQLRNAIKATAPKATEIISYAMPGY